MTWLRENSKFWSYNIPIVSLFLQNQIYRVTESLLRSHVNIKSNKVATFCTYRVWHTLTPGERLVHCPLCTIPSRLSILSSTSSSLNLQIQKAESSCLKCQFQFCPNCQCEGNKHCRSSLVQSSMRSMLTIQRVFTDDFLTLLTFMITKTDIF